MRYAIPIAILLCTSLTTSSTAQCIVEGVMTKNEKPLVAQSVMLMRQRETVPGSWTTKTDGKGRYRFIGVAPGEYTVGYEVPILSEYGTSRDPGSTFNHARTLFVEPGDTQLTVPPPAKGHLLTGTLLPPNDCKIKIAWCGRDSRRVYTILDWPKKKTNEPIEAFSDRTDRFRTTEDYKKQARNNVFLVPEIMKDGSFLVRDLPPGNYEIYIEIGDHDSDSGDQIGVVSARFKMPDKDYSLPPVTAKIFPKPLK